MKTLITTGLSLLLSIAICVEVGAKPKYYGKDRCLDPNFRCIKITKHDSWVKIFPNKHNREMVMRLNRTNMRLNLRRWILVPINLNNVTLHQISPLPLNIDKPKRKINMD